MKPSNTRWTLEPLLELSYLRSAARQPSRHSLPTLTAQRRSRDLPPLPQVDWSGSSSGPSHAANRPATVLSTQRQPLGLTPLEPLTAPPIAVRSSQPPLVAQRSPDELSALPPLGALTVTGSKPPSPRPAGGEMSRDVRRVTTRAEKEPTGQRLGFGATTAAIEVDLHDDERFSAAYNDAATRVASELVRIVSHDLRELVTTLAGSAPDAAVDALVCVDPSGAHGHQMIRDADRQTVEALCHALGAPVGTESVARSLDEAVTFSLSLSGAAGMTYLSEPVTSGAVLALDLGRPERRPVVRMDHNGGEVIVVRTIARLSARTDAPCRSSDLIKLLGAARDGLQNR